MPPEPSEGFEFGAMMRPRPVRPHVPTGRILELPAGIPEVLAGIFSSFAARGVEGCCFFFGTEGAHGATVRAVVTPPQLNAWGCYQVPREGMLAVARAMTRGGYEWINLAQVHSHPGRNVEHSAHDDQNAVSTRSLSLVLPWYGRIPRPWPTGIGLHEFQEGYWHLLPEETTRKTLALVHPDPIAVMDLRGR